MRERPRTRAQWTMLAVEAAKAIRKVNNKKPVHEVSVLSDFIEMLLIGPVESRIANFESLDRLLDKVNGVEYETRGARAIREFEERKKIEDARWSETVRDVRADHDGRMNAGLAEAAAMACRALDTILNAPSHVDGCLWLRDSRMPCQCGSVERIKAAYDNARVALGCLRAELESYPR